MNRLPKLWRNHNEAILYITLILIIIGTVNIFSAGFVKAVHEYQDSYYFLKRHLAMFGIGVIGMLIMSKMNYRHLQQMSALMLLGTIVLLGAVLVVGVEINGARRWINMGFQFQPSELAKLIIVIITANYLGRLIDRGRRITLLSTPFFLAGILGILVQRQPDMGTAVIIIGLCILLYLVAGLPKQQLYLLGGIGVSLFIYQSMSAGYRAARVAAWLNPWAYQQDIGYQTVQGLLAIGSGGFWGTGLGMGVSKFFYLPEAHTDFAFAILCQEMGFVGAMIVICLIAAFGFYGIKIAVNAEDGFGKMLALGCVFLVVGQSIINIAMVSGVIPVVGVPLPFISYGGTSLIINLMSVGLLLSVGRRAVNKAEGIEPQQSPPAHNRLIRRPRSLTRVK